MPLTTNSTNSRAGNIVKKSDIPWVLFTITAGIVVFLLWQLVPSGCVIPREAVHKTSCQSHLKQIGLALHNYLAEQGSFPPAYTVDATGRPMHSWRALILPYFDEDLATGYDLTKSWDSPENLAALQQTPDVYRCPSDSEAAPGTTNYLAVIGDETLWPGQNARKREEVSDGLSNTIAVVEVTDMNIPWAEPVDLRFEAIGFDINAMPKDGISSRHNQGANFLVADGSVRFMQSGISPVVLQALLTAAGEEKASPP